MCTPEQLEDEFRGCLELANYMLKTLGLYEDVSYRFSQWDPNDRDKYIGTPEQWDEAQGVMKTILDDLGLDYKIGIGEAAFYGPKLDIQIKNVHGKEDTLITIQIDQMLAPEQVRILPIADRHHDRAYEIKKQLESAGLRVTVDDRSEKIGYKIRESRLQRLPYWLIVGDKEVENGSVSVSRRGEGDIGAMEISALVARLQEEIATKARD